jgi:hypothetical protein
MLNGGRAVMADNIDFQNKFSRLNQQVETQNSLLQLSFTGLKLNYKFLMQKCFRGGIIS